MKTKATYTKGESCNSELCHGPGHQSTTRCQLTGKHDVHFAVYGCFDQEARWKGERAFTGFFDEPPKIKLDSIPKM